MNFFSKVKLSSLEELSAIEKISRQSAGLIWTNSCAKTRLMPLSRRWSTFAFTWKYLNTNHHHKFEEFWKFYIRWLPKCSFFEQSHQGSSGTNSLVLTAKQYWPLGTVLISLAGQGYDWSRGKAERQIRQHGQIILPYALDSAIWRIVFHVLEKELQRNGVWTELISRPTQNCFSGVPPAKGRLIYRRVVWPMRGGLVNGCCTW